jgi:lipoic acid synthetase
VALAARQLGLKHVVLTSVTRDDLADGGAEQFVATIKAIRQELPRASVEVLIPDFRGSAEALEQVIIAGPDILNHNVETVPRLYQEVRPQAIYARSLELFERVTALAPEMLTKSGVMLGLGETKEEVVQVMHDLHAAGCQILTLGQYLSPSPAHHPVVEFIHPDSFKEYERIGNELGFLEVFAGPLVRSSYNAAHTFAKIKTKKGGIPSGQS